MYELKGVIFILLLVGFFLMYSEMLFLRKLQDALKRTRKEMDSASRQRSLADRQRRMQLQEGNTLWHRIEQNLNYSGIRNRFPKITPEKMVVLQLLITAGIFLLTGILVGFPMNVVVVLGLTVLQFILLKILKGRNYRRTENGLSKLLDFLGNYSMISGDITGILEQVGKYMDEPIKGALESCYYDATITGDAGMALLTMGEKLEHPKFKELARNMEISVRYCADFSALVSSSRRNLQEFLRMSRERRELAREALINLIIILFMAVIMMMVVSRLTGVNPLQLIAR